MEKTRQIYRCAEGAIELGGGPTAVYDETNYGTDWILVSARSETEARKIATLYDALDLNPSMRPKYLKPVSLAMVTR